MSYGNHSGHGGLLALSAIVYVIAYVFGKRVARMVVGTALLVVLACFAYVMFRIVTGTL